MKENKTKEMILISFILIISFAVWLVVPYAQHLANNRELSWNYYVVKGIIVSFASLAVYLIAGKYGTAVFKNYSKLILYVSTAVVLAFAVFEYPLSRVDISAFSKAIAYAYAALPFLQVVSLCALAVCLDEILSGDISFSKIALIAAGTVLAVLLNNVLKVVLFIMLITILIKQFKSKDKGRKAAVIIVTMLSASLLAYIAYAFCDELKTLLIEWDNKSYMAYVSRNVWSQAKLFGTIDNLQVGGSIFRFSLLWLISFLGIIPTAIIVIAMPMVMDTVSGMLCSFLLLGLNNAYSKSIA